MVRSSRLGLQVSECLTRPQALHVLPPRKYVSKSVERMVSHTFAARLAQSASRAMSEQAPQVHAW